MFQLIASKSIFCAVSLGAAQDLGGSTGSADPLWEERPEALEMLQMRARKMVQPDDGLNAVVKMLQDMDEKFESKFDGVTQSIKDLETKAEPGLPPQGRQRDAPPSWLKNRPSGLKFNIESECRAKEPVVLMASNDTTLAAGPFTARCASSEVTLRSYANGEVKVTCCPATSLACAGCLVYNKGQDKCDVCDVGFVKAGGDSAATCQMCTDLPWIGQNGESCDALAKQGHCKDGKFASEEKKGLMDVKVRGALPSTACCACGGGLHTPTPFVYPANEEILPLGAQVKVFAMPRTATSYSTKDCLFHHDGLYLDSNSGTISGVVAAEEPKSLSCSVSASDSALHFSTSAAVTLNFEYFAYPEKTLPFLAGTSYTPKVAKEHSEYTLSCTPAVEWLSINHKDGSLTADTQAELTPTAAACTVTATYANCEVKQAAASLLQLNKAKEASGPEPGALGFEPVANEEMSNVVPSVGDVTVGQEQVAEAAMAAPECTDVMHSTDIVVVVPNEPKQLFMVHTKMPDISISEIDITVNQEVPAYGVVGAMDKSVAAMQHGPVAYHLDCGSEFAFSQLTGELTYQGHPVFGIDASGRLHGMASKAVLGGCKEGTALCQKSFACNVFGVLPFSKAAVVAKFQANIQDDVCWVKMDRDITHLQMIAKLGGSPQTEMECRSLCYHQAACAGFAFDIEAKACYSVRNAPHLAPNRLVGLQAYKKVLGCAKKSQCLSIHVPGAFYMSGQYCPADVEGHRSMLYVKEGVSNPDKYGQVGDSFYLEQNPGKPCKSTDQWQIRMSKRTDFVGTAPDGSSVVELKGRTMMCIEKDIVQSAFTAQSLVDFTPKVSGMQNCEKVKYQSEPPAPPPPPTYNKIGAGIANSGGNIWLHGVLPKGSGLEACMQAVLKNDQCAGNMMSYATRGDGNCGCNKRSGTSFLPDKGWGVDVFKIEVNPVPVPQCEKTLRVNILVPKCTSPLTQRTATRIASGLPEDYPEEDEAKEIFRFDDVATPLADDFSMGPCECLFPAYGDKWPVDQEVQKKIPAGSLGVFVPQSQMLIAGSVTCEMTGLKQTFTDKSTEDCAFEAKKAGAHFYVTGEVSGTVLCRLYETCNTPILEHESESFIFGVFFDTMCAVANPRKCWGSEKRRQFLTGFKTKVQPGQDQVTFSGVVPCAFQKVLYTCDRLQIMGFGHITNCGMCEYAAPGFVSQRRPLAEGYDSGVHMSVSCHPDMWKANGAAVNGGKREMVCVSGQWREMDGNLNIMNSFKCLLGVRVTSKETASLQQAARAESVPLWFESHFGKVIKSWDGFCLASLGGDNTWEPREADFSHSKWGQAQAHLPAAALPGGAIVSIWSKQSSRFLMVNFTDLQWGVTLTPNVRSKLQTPLEIRGAVSFRIVKGPGGKVALYNPVCRRFLGMDTFGNVKMLGGTSSKHAGVPWTEFAKYPDALVIIAGLPQEQEAGLYFKNAGAFLTADFDKEAPVGFRKDANGAEGLASLPLPDTFSFQILHFSFHFHAMGASCANSVDKGVQSEGTCKDLCEEQSGCSYYTAFSDGRCEHAMECAVAEASKDLYAVTYRKVMEGQATEKLPDTTTTTTASTAVEVDPNAWETECENCQECDWGGADKVGQFGLNGGGHTVEACIGACEAKSECRFAARSGSGYCHMFTTCNGKKGAGWTRWQKKVEVDPNAMEKECESCQECDWSGADKVGQFGLNGGGHTVEACIGACEAKSECRFAARSGSGYCHMFTTCKGKKGAGWTRWQKKAAAPEATPIAAPKYKEQANTNCGYGGNCGGGNDAHVAPGGSRLLAAKGGDVSECKKICDLSTSCGGFTFVGSVGNCYFRKNSQCNVQPTSGRACYTKQVSLLETGADDAHDVSTAELHRDGLMEGSDALSLMEENSYANASQPARVCTGISEPAAANGDLCKKWADLCPKNYIAQRGYSAPASECNEMAPTSSAYRGCQTKTTSGKTCQNWMAQSPQSHNTMKDHYVKGGGLGDHNYCRDPNGKGHLWCYTTDGPREQECEPIKQDPIEEFTVETVDMCAQENDKKQRSSFTFSPKSKKCILHKAFGPEFLAAPSGADFPDASTAIFCSAREGSVAQEREQDFRLLSYKSNGCGPMGPNYNQMWCNANTGKCPSEISVSWAICNSGKALLTSVLGDGKKDGSYREKGCAFRWYAKYVCKAGGPDQGNYIPTGTGRVGKNHGNTKWLHSSLPKGSGIQACYEAVKKDWQCIGDYFCYTQGTDQNCGCNVLKGRNSDDAWYSQIYQIFKDGCAETTSQGYYYDPIDMPGQGRSVERKIDGCRQRCKNTPGCRFFTWWSDGGCHITDANSQLKPGGPWYGSICRGKASTAAKPKVGYVFGKPREAECPAGSTKITSEWDCKQAALKAGKGAFQRATYIGSTPGGCIYDHRGVFFSTSQEQESHHQFAALCKTEEAGGGSQTQISDDWSLLCNGDIPVDSMGWTEWKAAAGDEIKCIRACQDVKSGGQDCTLAKYHQMSGKCELRFGVKTMPEDCLPRGDTNPVRTYWKGATGKGCLKIFDSQGDNFDWRCLTDGQEGEWQTCLKRVDTGCEVCQEGQFYSDQEKACMDCAIGKFSPSTGAPACQDCPAGEYQNNTAQAQCVKCEPGRFGSKASQAQCTACEAGKYMGDFGSAGPCFGCSPGEGSNEGAARCSVCTPGKYTLPAQKGCGLCAAGKYSDVKLLADNRCAGCGPGKYAPEGSPMCFACPAGKFSAKAAAGECEPCADGTWSGTAATACATCPCGEGATCTCDFGDARMSWTIEVPATEKGELYNVIMNFVGDNTKGCTISSGQGTKVVEENGNCDESFEDKKGEDYQGCQDRTISGRACQSWDETLPHTHHLEIKVLGPRPNKGHNYCRNPTGYATIWCYTQHAEVRWEYCQPKGGKHQLETTVKIMSTDGGDKGKVALYGETASCSGLQSVLVEPKTGLGWDACKEGVRDHWNFRTMPHSPGKFLLQFVATEKCVVAETGDMVPCDDKKIDQYLETSSLAPRVDKWTARERGDIPHKCVGSDAGSLCKPVPDDSTAQTKRTLLKGLAEVGTVGLSGSKLVLSTITLDRSAEGWMHTWYARSTVVDTAKCRKVETACSANEDDELWNLEGHKVNCAKNEALQSVELVADTCEVFGGFKPGYKYKYECCEVQGIGSCELISTGWTKTDTEQPEKSLAALGENALACSDNYALNGFVLESKDPGKSNVEIRYNYYCCHVPSVSPLHVLPQNEVIEGSYASFEGDYLPKELVEGRSVQELASALGANGELHTLVYNKYKGLWCLEKKGAAVVSCEASNAPHPIGIDSTNGIFEVTHLAEGLQAKVPRGPALKSLKMVKFSKPPRLKEFALEQKEFEQAQFEEFKAEKELKAFDLSTLATWMPESPNYAPYCAFKAHKPWETMEDIDAEQEGDWGIRKRQQTAEINTEEHKDLIDAGSMKSWHPCNEYFNTNSKVNWPDFTTKWDLRRLLSPQTFIDAYKAGKDFKQRSGEKLSETNQEIMDKKNGVEEVEEEEIDEDEEVFAEEEEEEDPDPVGDYLDGAEGNSEGFIADAAEDELCDDDPTDPICTGTEDRPNDDAKEAILSAVAGNPDAALDSLGLSYQEEDLRPKEKIMGLTPEALDKCETRQSTREAKFGEKELDHDFNDFLITGAETLGNSLCGMLPDAGTVISPLGIGAEVGFKPSQICETVVDGVKTTAAFVNDKLWEGWQTYKFENDARDDCNDFASSMMFKVYCDLHCIEDAVVQGNHAILKSMKTQEQHIVGAVHTIVGHYTTEVFDKMKESQQQADHNAKQLKSIMDNYFGQVMDTSYTYANALTNQLNVQLNQLNKNLGDTVVPPMMTLQKHINTVNENLMSLSTWLQGELAPGASLLDVNVDNEYQTHLHSLTQGGNASMGAVQHALGQVVEDTTALVSQLHADESADKSVNAVAVMPVLDRVVNVLGKHAARAKKALTNGNAKQAQKNILRASRVLRVAQSLIQQRSKSSIWHSQGVAFQRKAEVMLGPSHRRLRNEFNTNYNLNMHSLTFAATRKILMANVTDLAALSDQVELNQATDLMLRFEELSEELHNIGADYTDHAWLHLDARNSVLQELREAISSDTCNTEGTVDRIGARMASLDVAESDHVEALHKAWRETASSLTRMVNLLVDGGLLLHHMRLAAVGTESKDGRTLDHQIEHSLNKHSGLLVQQVSKAFDFSQLLANMWTDGMMDAPQDELVQVRNAWGRLKTASRQLRKKLKAGGELQQALVMLATRHSKAGSLLQTQATGRDLGKYLDPIVFHRHGKAKAF